VLFVVGNFWQRHGPLPQAAFPLGIRALTPIYS
jgi:hypothetical protein